MTPHQNQELIKSQIASCIGSNESLTFEELEKSAQDHFEKGRAQHAIGTIKKMGGRDYIKTSEGWKYHGQGTGKKAQENGKLADTSKKPSGQLGKTKSGKPVFGYFNHPEHEGFSKQDHIDAATLHEDDKNPNIDGANYSYHMDSANYHKEAASKMKEEKIDNKAISKKLLIDAHNTYKTVKAGSQRQKAVQTLFEAGRVKLGRDPHSIQEAIASLDLEEPKIR